MKRMRLIVSLLVGCAFSLEAGAAYVDLTAGGTGSLPSDYVLGGGNAVYASLATSVVGTGYIDPFLRINAGGNVNPEHGFNSDMKKMQYEEDHSWTSSLPLASVQIVTVGGTQFREFLLDINQNNNSTGQYLSLDAVRIWYGGAITQTSPATYNPDEDGGYDYKGAFSGKDAPKLTLAYSMDGINGKSENNAVLLDYSVCNENPVCPSGSAKGSGKNFDMRLLVPVAAFAGAAQNDFVTLFSSFGYLHGTTVNTKDGPVSTWAQTDGFEEWAVRLSVAPPPPGGGVPEPGTLALLGAGLAGLAFRCRAMGKPRAA